MLSRRQLLLSSLSTLGPTGSGAWAQGDLEGPEAPPSNVAPPIVPIQAGLPPGEIHVDPNRFALYWTLPDQTAIRYARGVGRPGL